MQQETEQAPEFQDYDTRTWASFGQLASRWEQINKLDRNEMLNELLQAYLRGKIWPVILPNLYGGRGEHGAILTGSPARPYWMKTTRRFPVETFTRLDFLRAARGYGHLVHAKDSPLVAGYRGLIGVSPNNYAPFFIETYIKKLTPCPNAVMRWCSGHGWPVPPGLSFSEINVSAADQEEHASESMKETETTGKARPGDARPDQQRKKTAAGRKGGGRKPGSGAYTDQDLPLWKKMKTALDNKNAVSPWEAAHPLAEAAKGKGTFDSKRRRLAAGYSNWIITQ